MNQPVGVLAALESHAQSRGERDAFLFLGRGEEVTERLSWPMLAREVDQIARGLAAEGLAGCTLALVFPPGLGFIAAFLACLRVSAVAVPMLRPVMADQRERLALLMADAQPDAMIVAGEEDAGAPWAAARTIALPRLLRAAHALPPMPPPEAPAFVQYTSGSTRSPRGIVLTHGNIAANLAMIRQRFGLDAGGIGVSWLPHHHDMGLIGAILEPVLLGALAVLMPPMAFLQRPLRWLRAIARHGATTAGGPSFGYGLLTRRVSEADLRALDLSAWTVAFCGAEPIRQRVLQDFAARFAPAGFRPSAFLPCYGLAEATLLVTGRDAGSGLRLVGRAGDAGASRVALGRPAPGCDLLLADEAGAHAPDEGREGEICVAGPHVSPGFWCGETRAVLPHPGGFEAVGKHFLRTGDLGAVLEGELVVLDRLKDVVAIHGRKLHATDIEGTLLEAALDEEVLAAAAFGVIGAGNEERLVVLCETGNRDLEAAAAVIPALSALVAERHGVVPHLALLRHGALPRTSSGKVRRQAAKAAWAEGLLATREAAPLHPQPAMADRTGP
ncbi:Acyl-CoA synthetase (AMP-forming)/AMP-acid ligase II [Roseomonas rosea]|uniref:Acyl-CoA synthetase (AMP-forming)/AMP-acid ligase II n=1 Tax=Muricoccus roseus TaxID=198092 RepID=A0A1M6B4Q3_9PROT|nr:fatty acyl-AMP ligase [Roseomonas rosea]SHI43685.1 Acyl-CoA synthetase (AMP-forming)/AMP-acid ligase II [Roseomonas rosea]